MKLSIIIPVYNEENTVGKVVKKVDRVKIIGFEKEIIVVDDGSSDSTLKEVKLLKKEIKDLKVISHEKNQGKGAAVKTGIKNSTGDFILIQDADLEYNPEDIGKLLVPIKNGETKVVYGTRLKRMPNFSRDERTFRFIIHYFGNKFLSFLTSALYRQWITDMETGYKIFPKSSLSKINLVSKSFNFEPEITAKLLKNGYKIKEIPITTNPRDYKEGKKLNTVRDGVIALQTLIKYRFVD